MSHRNHRHGMPRWLRWFLKIVLGISVAIFIFCLYSYVQTRLSENHLVIGMIISAIFISIVGAILGVHAVINRFKRRV